MFKYGMEVGLKWPGAEEAMGSRVQAQGLRLEKLLRRRGSGSDEAWAGWGGGGVEAGRGGSMVLEPTFGIEWNLTGAWTVVEMRTHSGAGLDLDGAGSGPGDRENEQWGLGQALARLSNVSL